MAARRPSRGPGVRRRRRPGPSGGQLRLLLAAWARSATAQPPVEPSAPEPEGGQGSGQNEWFCNHNLPWDECQKYLHSEQWALDAFLVHLEAARTPPPEALQGRGIVMSGGPMHVLMALANLAVLRHVHNSTLPVEFWHAFELAPAHCEALAALGAVCRPLQVPGVYPQWQTTLPAILASSFRELLWMDTDVTPLLPPERLFETDAYQREGALFWPDLWGAGCSRWGATAWPWHVNWHLLRLAYNASDTSCVAEHEAGHLLIDRVRHWRPLCLANYLASRDFFARVMHGYKDVFRFAWLKLGASGWLSPLRPGLVGAVLRDGRFLGLTLVHFWPAGEDFGPGTDGRPVPLYLHQKKKPSRLSQELVTFTAPLGECAPLPVGLEPFYAGNGASEMWFMNERHPELFERLAIVEDAWEKGWTEARQRLEADARLEAAELRAPVRGKGTSEFTRHFSQMVLACKCDYANNFWPGLINLMLGAGNHAIAEAVEDACKDAAAPGRNATGCEVGSAALALLCSQGFLRRGRLRRAAKAAAALEELLPSISECLKHSFWPMKLADLQAFAAEFRPGAGQAAAVPAWRSTFELPQKQKLARFPRYLLRCVPLRDPGCWPYSPRETQWAQLPHLSCALCCDPGFAAQPWRAQCFDGAYTEERCCQAV